MTVTDPYAVLGIDRSASQDDIRTAYRKLARQYHPDVNPDNPEAEEKFKEISQAYSILSDPDTKARFDQYGTVEDMGGGGDHFGGFQDIFESFFGAGMGARGHRPNGPISGDDLQVDVHIALEEVLTGTEKEIDYRRLVTCETCSGHGTKDGSPAPQCVSCAGMGVVVETRQTFFGAMRTQVACGRCKGSGVYIVDKCENCHGNGRQTEKTTVNVKIPAGVESGARLLVEGGGDSGIRNGRAGDLFVRIGVKKHERFARQGMELHANLDISFPQAVLGAELEFEGLAEPLTVEVPAGTQIGDKIEMKQQGLPPLHGGRRGSLYLHARITVPKKVTAEEREMLTKYAEQIGTPVKDEQGLLSGLFKKKKK